MKFAGIIAEYDPFRYKFMDGSCSRQRHWVLSGWRWP